MARGAPVGSVVGLYIDSAQELEEGDFITTRTGRCYRVVTNRVQQRGKHAGRQHMRVRVVERAEVDEALAQDPDTVVQVIWWYSRG